MQKFWVFTAFILVSKCDNVFSDDNYSAEKVEEQSLASELVDILNGTYFNINEKVCQLQRRVDAIEQVADSDKQCDCHETETSDFKQAVSGELHAFSKILSGFENRLRILQSKQTELRELLDNDEVATMTTTMATTTPVRRACDPGWITSPEKCYYVSASSEKNWWSYAIRKCSAKGANLVEIQTDEEASFISRNLPSHVSYTELIYTGRKKINSDDWVFVSNNQLVDTSVRSWGSGETPGAARYCGCTRQSDDFRMLECLCSGINLLYICEIVR